MVSPKASGFTVLVQTKEQLQAVLEGALSVQRIYVEYTLWIHEQQFLRAARREKDCEWALALPQMLRESYRDRFLQLLPSLERENFDGYLIRTMEELCLCLDQGVHTALYLDDCMYTMSRETLGKWVFAGLPRRQSLTERNWLSGMTEIRRSVCTAARF